MRKNKIFAAFILFAALTLNTTASADNGKAITLEKLPQAARTFVQNYYPDSKVAYVIMERDFLEVTYELMFTNGTKVEFSKNGQWYEIDCKYGAVPSEVVPSEILKYVAEHYPDTEIEQIEHDHGRYDVKITNGLEITFDKRFNVIDIDD